MKNYVLLWGLGLLILSASACKELEYKWHYRDVQDAVHKTQDIPTESILKAHLKNGEVYFFPGAWWVDTNSRSVQGMAYHYDANRDFLDSAERSLPIASVSLFEVNKELNISSGHQMLAPLTVVNIGLSFVCLANPKACFGSCPTFYSLEDQGLFSARAEGFSNAICPSLEYADIDDLKISEYSDSLFTLVMKNEAQETHVLRSVQLLALAQNEGERIYQSRKGDFYATKGLWLPRNNELLAAADGQEYFSDADAENLASKEELILEFDIDASQEDLGLVLDFRQTLMTTYFIYSALSYMGDEVADIIAKFENSGDLYETMDQGLKSELGELEVYLWNEIAQRWDLQGSFYETGPIAINRQILDLAHPPKGPLKLKLVMNRGLWRIDRAAICSIQRKLEPQALKPIAVRKAGIESAQAKDELNDPQLQLVSMPGDYFELDFILDPNQEYALFLKAEGYYLEWMRKEWLADKDLWKLRQMFKQPSLYLKREAEAYKVYEQNMEEVFWSSQVPAEPLTLKP